jgi:hypothetical protein
LGKRNSKFAANQSLFNRIAGIGQLVEQLGEVLRDEMRQHEAVVQGRPPPHEAGCW